MQIELFVFIGAFFGLLAALVAFGVTFVEWQHHLFEGWKLWREPLRRALFTFLFFFLLSVALGFVLPFIIQQ